MILWRHHLNQNSNVIIVRISVLLLVERVTPKRHFEINWPLVSQKYRFKYLCCLPKIYESLPNDCLMTAWQLSDDCPMTARRLPDDCPMTARRLHNDCPMTTQRLPDDCPMTALRLHNDCPMTAQRLPDDCPMNAWRLPGDCRCLCCLMIAGR